MRAPVQGSRIRVSFLRFSQGGRCRRLTPLAYEGSSLSPFRVLPIKLSRWVGDRAFRAPLLQPRARLFQLTGDGGARPSSNGFSPELRTT